MKTMNTYLPENRKSNYDKFPVVAVPGGERSCVTGWERIVAGLETCMRSRGVRRLVVECYQGVCDAEVLAALRAGFPDAAIFESRRAMKEERALYDAIGDDVTDDEIFGYLTRRTMPVYFDAGRVERMRRGIAACEGVAIVYGTGASYIWEREAVIAYLDMTRWEIQMRFRRNEVSNIGFDNRMQRASLRYKQAYFVDWRICDRWKKRIWTRIDFFIDTNVAGQPKSVPAASLRSALAHVVRRPFRVVPYFDAGPWGGQWMKEVCDLDRSAPNFAWCFDCVPEENTLSLGFGGVRFDIPAVDLVFAHPDELLGANVYGRFGDEFPIRFDFLDTMGGGNLSLQVHPLVEYIQEKFGMHYTQEESYYILDAEPGAKVYLGLREGVDPDAMLAELREAQRTGCFDAERHVGVYPVKRHDHVLIPPGTVHCSGAGSMVLEISATPYIFTFKLWDWGRLGLDGRPRPINIEHGSRVIRWERTESWVRREALNRFVDKGAGEGWREEQTGLHEREFIETRRHWFTAPVLHRTNGSVQVLNLVEGREAVVESPSGAFDPFVVHYAETFIVPAAVGEYTVRPCGESEGCECATVKAYIRK